MIVPATAGDVDEIAALLADACEPAKEGTEVRGDEVVIWAPLADQEATLAEVRVAVAAFAEAGLGVDPGAVRAQPALPEAEWRDAWKRYFHVTRVSPRLVVVPSWESFTPGPDDVTIALDPGMAFGTGTHASTRLVLEELDRLAADGRAPAAVLDVGAGSGILAIAAVKLWPAARVIAVDNDPIAVAACAENAAVNAASERITAAATPVGEVGGTFELVLANIQAHVLRELRDAIAPRVAPGGTLILSGLLTPQAEAVADEYVAAGLRKVAIRPSAADPAWSSAVLERP
ncbi:MAG: 50S ribosomal protein L11 methyltransferase [Kofleriaceae bacterium]|nr:50S ribosomal protein L11 methyltransferase [Kofleriaceae bacterium]MBP9168671.1 50S ribosomal protein L11 methyltransferase [Kofleriaceae bacterium]MBP9857455.1 50S ribosomal protein L11 methyltransferase [Kofleriaceae bacterium]